VLLAGLTTDEIAGVLPGELTPVTPHTIVDRAALFAELEVVRDRGWAFEREQGTEGVACVAAAVDYRIPATDAVSCSMPAHLADGAELDRVVKAVTAHTQRLSATLRRHGIR
jgi:DNA-binding IclR family transcriptional regulator